MARKEIKRNDGKSHSLNHLSDKALKRHFSHELGGGKGDHARRSTPESRKNFSDNYDKIDWSKK